MTIFHLKPSAQNTFYFRQIHSVSRLCRTLSDSVDRPTRFLCLWNSSGKKTGVGCQFLLQGIFSTQETNLHLLRLLYWQVDSLPTVVPGKPQGFPLIFMKLFFICGQSHRQGEIIFHIQHNSLEYLGLWRHSQEGQGNHRWNHFLAASTSSKRKCQSLSLWQRN